MKNKKIKLVKYPTISGFSHFEACKARGIGLPPTGIGEETFNGRTLVYTSTITRECEKNIEVYGYKVEPQGIFKKYKSSKIMPIQENEKEKIRSKLTNILGNNKTKLGWISFYQSYLDY